MKRIRCPKCDNYITFDETRYNEGETLVFVCDNCGRQVGMRLGTTPVKSLQRDAADDEPDPAATDTGAIVVIENMFAFRQVLPLKPGDNVIGRYQQGKTVDCPIESSDPSLDMHHCVLSVTHDGQGGWKYVLRDGPSFTGTFVGDELLGKRERRVISDGTLFTLGATSVLLKTKEK